MFAFTYFFFFFLFEEKKKVVSSFVNSLAEFFASGIIRFRVISSHCAPLLVSDTALTIQGVQRTGFGAASFRTCCTSGETVIDGCRKINNKVC